MPLNSEFLKSLLVKKLREIGQYLVRIWSKCNSLLCGPPMYSCRWPQKPKVTSGTECDSSLTIGLAKIDHLCTVRT